MTCLVDNVERAQRAVGHRRPVAPDNVCVLLLVVCCILRAMNHDYIGYIVTNNYSHMKIKSNAVNRTSWLNKPVSQEANEKLIKSLTSRNRNPGQVVLMQNLLLFSFFLSLFFFLRHGYRLHRYSKRKRSIRSGPSAS